MKGYHLTPEQNMPSIRAHGLRPGNRWRRYVWFFRTRVAADRTHPTWPRIFGRGPLALLEVDLDGYEILPDPDLAPFGLAEAWSACAVRVTAPIPVERIKHIATLPNEPISLMEAGRRILGLS